MKLLFDENLSRKLVVRLAELYPESAHVGQVDLLQSLDREIWEFARITNFVIVSTDADFYELATRVLRREAIRITDSEADPELGVLVLDRD